MQDFFPQRLAELALSIYEGLPSKFKPRTYPDGRREWTPLSAIILRHRTEGCQDEIKCIAIATGTKCLPASSLSNCEGAVLHDCHAEILALRCFNYWILNEIENSLQTGSESKFLVKSGSSYQSGVSTAEATSQLPFRIRSGISIYLFSTEAPCGDASMELLMSSKPSEKNQPWSAENLAIDLADGMPLGRGHFSLLGAMRRKPSRRDAMPSVSKSCTDKLMMKQFTSLLAFPTDLFIEATSEAFLKGLIVYQNQFHEAGYKRAFGQNGRLYPVDDTNAVFFDFHTLPAESFRFAYERKYKRAHEPAIKATNISTIWIANVKDNKATIEVLVNGVKQGFQQFENRKGKQSVICRQSMMEKAIHVSTLQVKNNILSGLNATTQLNYYRAKAHDSRKWKMMKKQAMIAKLGGWPSPSFSDDFMVSLESKA